MIISKFKSNQPALLGLLLLIAAALWIDGFLQFRQIGADTQNPAPIYMAMAHFFDTHRFWNVLLAFLFMLLQAFMFNRIIAGRNLVERNSMMPALMYIVLMSSSFSLMGLHPVLFANFFLLLAMGKIFDVYSEEEVFIEIFNVGFFVSIAAMFYLPALWFILLMAAALLIYYFLNLRGFLASLIGFVTPWMFLALYYYWFDKLEEKVEAMQALQWTFTGLGFGLTPFGWASLGVIGFIGLIAIAKIYLGGMMDKPIRIRKRYQVLLASLGISLLTVFFSGKLVPWQHGVILLPLAGILAGFFHENRSRFWNELLFSLLIVLIIVGKLARLE
ncbi:MAG: hypothetical protein ACK4VN_02125 [Bacteroidales bacterium]